MSLTGRFSLFFLSALGLVLLGFSLTLYVSARVYLGRQLSERLAASLAVLAAAAEVHPEGVEWEPQERVLPLGQESGPERLRWMVFDPAGRRIDHSHNLVDAELTALWNPGPGKTGLPGRLADGKGRLWKLSQRAISSGSARPFRSTAETDSTRTSDSPSAEAFYPFLVLTVCAPLDPMQSTLAALAWFLVTLSMSIWLLSALLCRWLSRQALIPLTKLVESARNLDATDPGWCLEQVGTGDELDLLGRTFNDLLSRLHLAYERQRRFSSDASHQLRTPLTVLIGQIEVALRQERPLEEYRRVLKSALGRAGQLARIVESLLFLARAETHAALPECVCLELNHWAALHLANRTVTDPAMEIVHVGAQSEGLCVRAHASLLDQLLDNLLDNAGKYSPPGARVVVETVRDGENAVLAVEDHGPGIAPADQARVFEPFFRAAGGGVPGVGLGLAVVHRIAIAFGGSVTVRSELGKGARFEIRLPIADARFSLLDDSKPEDLPKAVLAHRHGAAAAIFDTGNLTG
jgi:signal transduction histidine kinase